MGKASILEELGDKSITADNLAKDVLDNLKLLPKIFKGISSDTPRIRFGCAKILRTVSEQKPEALYRKMDFFVELLDSENTILKWNAMDVVANLAKVDTENKFEKVSQRFFGFLSEGSLVTAAHVVDNSGRIIQAKPGLQKKVTKELLEVEKLPLPTKECTNILAGKAISAFDAYYDIIEDKESVGSFVKRQLSNARVATRKKAERFLAKHQ